MLMGHGRPGQPLTSTVKAQGSDYFHSPRGPVSRFVNMSSSHWKYGIFLMESRAKGRCVFSRLLQPRCCLKMQNPNRECLGKDFLLSGRGFSTPKKQN